MHLHLCIYPPISPCTALSWYGECLTVTLRVELRVLPCLVFDRKNTIVLQEVLAGQI